VSIGDHWILDDTHSIVRDSQFYMGEFRSLCAKEKMTELKWPERDYIIQVARFDPAKGQFHLRNSFPVLQFTCLKAFRM
jgi:hypothetical protein